jgi:hypothetical protein
MVNGPESNEWVPIGGQPLGLRLLVSVAAKRERRCSHARLVGDGPAGPEDPG